MSLGSNHVLEFVREPIGWLKKSRRKDCGPFKIKETLDIPFGIHDQVALMESVRQGENGPQLSRSSKNTGRTVRIDARADI